MTRSAQTYAPPASGSLVASYRILPRGKVHRRVLSPDGRTVLGEQEIDLVERTCTCGTYGCPHVQYAAEKVAAWASPRRIDPGARFSDLYLRSLEDSLREQTDPHPDTAPSVYDGGYLSGITAEDVIAHTRDVARRVAERLRAVFGPPQGEEAEPGWRLDLEDRAYALLLGGMTPQQIDAASRGRAWVHWAVRWILQQPPRLAASLISVFGPREELHTAIHELEDALSALDRSGVESGEPIQAWDVAGEPLSDADQQLVAICRRVARSIPIPPRIVGDRDDLEQLAVTLALEQRRAGVPMSRIARVLRWRLIDTIRRQQVVQAHEELGMDESGAVCADDPFWLILRQASAVARDRRDTETERILAAVYADARSLHLHARGETREALRLARKILRRAWRHVFRGRTTRGTMDFEGAPGYSRAVEWIRDSWGRHLSQVLRSRLACAS